MYLAGTKRLLHKGGKLVSSQGVALRPELAHAIAEATRDLPEGYRAEIFSGADARSTGTKNHPAGVAIDLRIVDANGRQLPAAGFDASLKIYEQLFQSVRIRAQHLFPGRNLTWIWGGAWISAAAGNGDRMHYQINDPARPISGDSEGSGSYNPQTGIARNNAHASAFMSPAELSAYQARIGSQAALDYLGGIPPVPQTAAEAIMNSSSESAPTVAVRRTPPDVLIRMGAAITLAEAARDAQGHLKIISPAVGGGGAFEIAGITVGHHPEAANRIRALLESGQHAAAEAAVGEFTASFTDAADPWTASWAIEFILRSCVFHRGPTGAAKILQRALIKLGENIGASGERHDGVDGKVGALTTAAVQRQERNVDAFLSALRVAREDYEREDVGYRAQYWNGFTNRWNNETVIAKRFHAEQQSTQEEPPVIDPDQPSQPQQPQLPDLSALFRNEEVMKVLMPIVMQLFLSMLTRQGVLPQIPVIIDQPAVVVPPKPPELPPSPPATQQPPAVSSILGALVSPSSKIGMVLSFGLVIAQMMGWLPASSALGAADVSQVGQVVTTTAAASPVAGMMGAFNPIVALFSRMFTGNK